MIDVGSVLDRTRDARSGVPVLLAGIVVVGFLVRVVGLGAESLWVDEMYTVRTVLDRRLAYIVLRLPIQDPHPPLYYVVVELWTGVTGVSAVSVRSVSVLAGVASIPLVHAVATRLSDRRVGLFAALLFALSPFYVWYAREARMYSLLTLLALGSTYAMLELLAGADGSRRTVTGYALSTVALVYTHAFGALLLLAQNVYVVGFLGPEDVDDRWFERWTRIQGAVAVASIPWLYNLLGGTFGEGRFRNNVSWIPDVGPVTLWKILGSYVGRTHPPSSPGSRRSLWVFESVGDLSFVGEAVTLLALVLLLFPFARWLRSGGADDAPSGATAAVTGDGPGDGRNENRNPTPVKPGPFLWCWLLVPVGTLTALSVLVTPLLFDRFTAVAGVAALILLARETTHRLDTDRRTLLAVGLVVLVLAVPLANVHSQPQKQQWEEATTVVESNAPAGTTVLVAPFWANDSYQYYAERDDLRYAGLPAGAGPAASARATADARVAWVVVAHHNASQRARLLSSLDGLDYRRERHVPLRELDVYRFVRRSRTE